MNASTREPEPKRAAGGNADPEVRLVAVVWEEHARKAASGGIELVAVGAESFRVRVVHRSFGVAFDHADRPPEQCATQDRSGTHDHAGP